LRAVNQSLGRVIRHSKDYGAMFLLDQRYKQNRNQAAMPSWATK
jgi:Rad3-related DNA helicase